MALRQGWRENVCVLAALAIGGCTLAPEPGQPERPGSVLAAKLRSRPTPVQLVGMRADAVDALLGAPDLQRQERQAVYQRHDIDGCALDLYLYPDRKSGVPEVVWFEVRPIDPGLALDPDACAWLEERLGRRRNEDRRADLRPS